MRAGSLDALRGFSIVMMVLCSAIVTWVLPAWMSHCQEPPPDNTFDPSIFGITWVDLVFPFFLFSMGAAIPFSVGDKIDNGRKRLAIIGSAFARAARMTFFAIFLQYSYPWASSCPDPTTKWIIGLAAFILLFPMFTRFGSISSRWIRFAIHCAGYILGVALMLWSNSYSGQPFNLYRSNIIILVLADMALFGTLIYVATYRTPHVRLVILALLLGLFLSSGTIGSWQSAVMEWSPLPWFYRMRYLGYLFVVVPGIYAGEYLRQWLNRHDNDNTTDSRHAGIILLAILCVAMIIINLWSLYTRDLTTGLLISIAGTGMIAVAARMCGSYRPLMVRLTSIGSFLLILGLFFEAYQGGIRKDDPTYSYYFVTSGLAFYSLTILFILCDIYRMRRTMSPLTMAGKNPMIAYVSTSLLFMPLFNLCGIGDQFLWFWASGPWTGLAREVILTALAILVTMFFTRIKLYWRT